MRPIYILLAYALIINACKNGQIETSTAELENSQVEVQPIAVKTVPIQQASFPLKITSNGTLRAKRKLEIKSESIGKIIQLAIEEGKKINKGNLIFRLDDTAKQLQLEQYQLSFEEAEVNKADLLIANGGQAYVDTSVSTQKLQLINTLSGYNKALHAIKQAKYELSKVQLFAPFTGIVADVKVQQDQQISSGETICTLIDPNSFEVVFSLLERDAAKVKKGEKVSIQPISLNDVQLIGSISSINPIVNEQGLVNIYARLSNAPKRLFEGMNVKVSIERPIPKQLIIPKSAVVLRSDKDVVFTYENAFAKWNYVTIAHENDQSIAISEGLTAKDTIIYEGNLNLDHDAEVILEETHKE